MTLPDGLDPARVCAVLAPLIAEERRARITTVLEARLGGLVVVLENLHDPHNGAAALRSCEAAGLTTVHVVDARERERLRARWYHDDVRGADAVLRRAGLL